MLQLQLNECAVLQAAPRSEAALSQTLQQAIGQMAQDLSDSVERGAWSMGSDEHVAHMSHRLRDRVRPMAWCMHAAA